MGILSVACRGLKSTPVAIRGCRVRGLSFTERFQNPCLWPLLNTAPSPLSWELEWAQWRCSHRGRITAVTAETIMALLVQPPPTTTMRWQSGSRRGMSVGSFNQPTPSCRRASRPGCRARRRPAACARRSAENLAVSKLGLLAAATTTKTRTTNQDISQQYLQAAAAAEATGWLEKEPESSVFRRDAIA